MESTIRALAEKLSSSFLSYYQLWKYIDGRILSELSGAQTHHIKSSIEFYEKLNTGELKTGHRVRLEKFYVSDWIPRQPGALARLVIFGGIREAQYADLYDTAPCGSDFHGLPLGSVRLNNDKLERKLLGATTAAEYLVDAGIVMSVSDQVYRQFLARQGGNMATELDAEGVVSRIDLGSHAASSANVNLRAQSSESYGLVLDSPLQCSFRTHGTHPLINSWLIREIAGPDVGRTFDGEYGDEWTYPRFDYVVFPLTASEPKQLLEASEILRRMPPVTMSFGRDRFDYLSMFNLREDEQKSALTEFDGKYELLIPRCPLPGSGSASAIDILDKQLREILSNEH